MKKEMICSWLLRVSNSSTETVEYRTLDCLTATEVEQVAQTVMSIDRALHVAVFKLHKMF